MCMACFLLLLAQKLYLLTIVQSRSETKMKRCGLANTLCAIPAGFEAAIIREVCL